MISHPTRHPPPVVLGLLVLACGHSHPQKPEPASAAIPTPPANTVQGPAPGTPAPRTLDQMLAGKISGVSVSPGPHGGIVVRMMGGGTSYYAGQDPLYIVDGTQVETINGGLPWINPADIESITALKNPADLALYGVRGANGVIVIKTKKAAH
jgi:TonB-dependent SusC/RagA subfamily outer membrane receptor